MRQGIENELMSPPSSSHSTSQKNNAFPIQLDTAIIRNKKIKRSDINRDLRSDLRPKITGKYGNSSDYKTCGECHELFNNPSFSSKSLSSKRRQECLSNLVLTCANHTDKRLSCKSQSPHFHFSCCQIPENSLLYRNLTKNHIDFSKQSNPSNTSDSSEQIYRTHRVSSSRIKLCHVEHNNGQDIKHLFECSQCDVQGSSRYLLEYFESFIRKKNAFYEIDEKVVSTKSRNEFDDNRLGSHRFVQYLVDKDQQQNEQQQKEKSKLKICCYKNTEIRLDRVCNILTGINRIRQVNLAMNVSHDLGRGAIAQPHSKTQCFSSTERSRLNTSVSFSCRKQINPKIRLEMQEEKGKMHGTTPTVSYFSSERTSKINFAEENKAKKITGSIKKIPANVRSTVIDPTHFVGQPIQLYCYVDNRYHVGR